jgi:4-hydroxybenzoate polyprenyltransferase
MTKAWLQLVRLPNVFTALADVLMGYLVTHGGLEPWPHFSLLAAASCSLYMSGMILNDVFDAEVDARERPQRPIPSGRVARRTAAACGFALLATGMLTTWFASAVTQVARPAIIGTLLAISIILYDRTLKRTPVAPLVMGACRTFNVLLGMSLASSAHGLMTFESASPRESPTNWLLAAGIGVYTVGVTWFARTEAHTSSRSQLIGGTAVIVLGIAMLASVPHWNDSRLDPQLVVSINGWNLLWIALAVIIVRRCAVAIYDPSPQRVQAAVRNCVFSIIALNAAICVGLVGPGWGLAVLALYVPTILLTAWLKAT